MCKVAVICTHTSTSDGHIIHKTLADTNTPYTNIEQGIKLLKRGDMQR